MRRTAAILTLVLVVSLLVTSDVRGGGGALNPLNPTSGPMLTATIVIDVTNPPGGSNPDKGLTSIRVQKADASAAVIFRSSRINGFLFECTNDTYPNDVQATTEDRFLNDHLESWVDELGVLSSLLSPITDKDPLKAGITDIDYAACTTVNNRQILSFTAVIRFEK